MRKKCLLTGLMLMGAVVGMQAIDLTSSDFRVVLPSSQFTPAQTWNAQVMIFNNGERYADASYNKVIGTPPTDEAGKAWYEADYTLTNGTQSWEERTSPFSSDEYYKGKYSSRWVVSDIMADIYLRRSFTVTEGFGGDVYLACGHDDAPSEWYINGVQVMTVSDGWNNDEYIRLNDSQKALIKTDGSENIIAVHVHQNWGGAFADCGLYEDLNWNTTSLLPAARVGGPWESVYYLLNSNDEIGELSPKSDWAGVCVDEIDWAYAEGPYSNSNDRFLNTDWDGVRHPILVRRHFTLTADDIEHLDDYVFTLSCSYDEDPKVYLNGTLIWSAEGWNDNDYAEYEITYAQMGLLREGDNVLAVSLESGEGGAHIDYGLDLLTPYKEPAPSSIDRVKVGTEGDDRVYNVMGQQVGTAASKLQKGLYIVNGKKTIVK